MFSNTFARRFNRRQPKRSQLMPYLVERSLLGVTPAGLMHPSWLYTGMRLDRQKNVYDCQDLQFTDDGLANGRKEVIISLENTNDDETGLFEFWDIRQPDSHLGSIECLEPAKHMHFFLYSKKESILMTLGGEYGCSLVFYNKASLEVHFAELSGWTVSVTDGILSSDCSTLVLHTVYNFFIIIRDLCFNTFAEDLRNFQPLTTVTERLNLDESWFDNFYWYKKNMSMEKNINGAESMSSLSRNRPEIVLSENWEMRKPSDCPDMVISNMADYFIANGNLREKQAFAVYSLTEEPQSPGTAQPSVRPSTMTRYGACQDYQDDIRAAISPDGKVVVAYDDDREMTNFYSFVDTKPVYYRSQQQHKELEIIHSIESDVVIAYAFSPSTNTLVSSNESHKISWYSLQM